jgi:cytochrome b subunit of formate dehydrogenase
MPSSEKIVYGFIFMHAVAVVCLPMWELHPWFREARIKEHAEICTSWSRDNIVYRNDAKRYQTCVGFDEISRFVIIKSQLNW